MDFIKPTTTMKITGIEDGEGGYISTVQIKLLAEDDNSGILKIEYSMDNRQTWTDYNEPIVIEEDGEYDIIYSSTDRAGNREIEQQKIIKIKVLSDIDLAILNIEKLYQDEELNQKANNKLINRLEDIKAYIEKYGQREIKRSEKQEEIIKKCIEKKGEEFCENKLGKIFDQASHRLNKIHKKIVEIRYDLLLKELKLYNRLNWVSAYAYDIIKKDIENLISNL